MFRYRRLRTKLQREINALSERYDSAYSADRDSDATHEHMVQLVDLENDLKALDSQRLAERAWKFGVDLADGFSWESHPWRTATWLGETDQLKAQKIISDARFAWWKRWVEILSPIASVIISILAFAVAVLALYLQLISDNPTIP